MTSYTDIFGGNTIYAADPSYLALALSANTTLEWPMEANAGSTVVARIIDVTPTAAYAITMPPADTTSVGQLVLFNNVGAYTVTIKDTGGNTLASIASGEVWQIYLRNNSTANGSWRVFRFGAATASAQASALAGYGLVADGSLLSQDTPVTSFNATYTIAASDRAKTYVWTGGAGTLNLTAAATLGDGFFFALRNDGSGALTVDASSAETINGATTLVLQPDDSALFVCDGTAWFTVGYGQQAIFAFDYTSVNIAGSTNPYTLSGAELNRIAYSFTGLRTANVEIVVPSTIQQYWIANNTTGAYTLGVKTSGGTPVTVTQGSRGIYYCNGAEVVNAATASIATPLAITDGGTGSTTASGARINLGGTSLGIDLFTTASAAAARTSLNAVTPEAAQEFAVAIA
jgi:hypothetical protein